VAGLVLYGAYATVPFARGYPRNVSVWLMSHFIPCAAVLCCAVLCCAVLCCAVLCCAVLCCAVLCCAAVQDSFGGQQVVRLVDSVDLAGGYCNDFSDCGCAAARAEASISSSNYCTVVITKKGSRNIFSLSSISPGFHLPTHCNPVCFSPTCWPVWTVQLYHGRARVLLIL